MTPEQKGAAVLVAAAAGVAIAMFNVSRDAFVLLVWVLGAAAIWYAAKTPNKSVHHAPDPAPPPPPERGSEEEPQVTMVRDTTHPNRWTVARPSPWLTEEVGKDRDES